MAATITTDVDLMAAGYILAEDKERLTPGEFADGLWTVWHTEAWSEVKRQLAARRQPIAESDLKDPTELKPPVLRFVLYLAYSMGRDMEMAKEQLAMFKVVMNQVRPTLNSGDSIRWGRTIRMRRSS